MSPVVSFIITVYNKAPYIPRMLSGLYQQEGNFSREYIFIDDGSTDNSVALLRQLTEEWPNVTLITQENKGPSAALNVGIHAAKGQYLKFVDGDDVLVHNATEQMLLCAEQFDVPIVFGKLKTSSDITLHDIYRLPTSVRKVLISSPLTALFRGQYHQMNSIGATPSLVTREAALSVGGADERVWLQDFSFALKLYHRHKAAYMDGLVCFCPEETAHRLSTNKFRESYNTLLTMRYFLSENPLSGTAYSFATKRAAKRAFEGGKNLPRFKRLFYKLIRNTGWVFFRTQKQCLGLLDQMLEDLETHSPDLMQSSSSTLQSSQLLDQVNSSL